MTKTVKYVGLDVHKNTIAVAVAEDGKIANTPAWFTVQPAACSKAVTRR